MKRFRVVIPYLHEFHVEAENEEEAIRKAKEEGNGKVTGVLEDGIEVEDLTEDSEEGMKGGKNA